MHRVAITTAVTIPTPTLQYSYQTLPHRPITEASRAVCDCGFEYHRWHVCLSVVSCQVEVCARGRSLVQRSVAEYRVCECDLETSVMRRLWSSGGCRVTEEKMSSYLPGYSKHSLCQSHTYGISTVSYIYSHFNPYPTNVENMVSS